MPAISNIAHHAEQTVGLRYDQGNQDFFHQPVELSVFEVGRRHTAEVGKADCGSLEEGEKEVKST